MSKKVSKSEIDIEKMVVEAIFVKREIRYYDIRVRLGGKTYIVPVCEDSDNKKTNFDFRNLPNISDEDCGIAMEIIETQIDQMPPLADCKHVKDHPEYEEDFYHGTTGNRDADKFFDDAIREFHDWQHKNELKQYPEIEKVRGLIRSLPEDRQVFYAEFLRRDKFTAKIWDNLIYALHGEILRN
jgi:hypothetical protein